MIPYPHLREADVMYKKRVWQVIDLEQKFNQPFYYPSKKSKTERTHQLIGWAREERIIAYRPGANQDDEFTEPILTQAGLDSILKRPRKSQLILEGVGSRDGRKVVDLDWELVTRYKIKEEWIGTSNAASVTCASSVLPR